MQGDEGRGERGGSWTDEIDSGAKRIRGERGKTMERQSLRQTQEYGTKSKQRNLVTQVQSSKSDDYDSRRLARPGIGRISSRARIRCLRRFIIMSLAMGDRSVDDAGEGGSPLTRLGCRMSKMVRSGTPVDGGLFSLLRCSTLSALRPRFEERLFSPSSVPPLMTLDECDATRRLCRWRPDAGVDGPVGECFGMREREPDVVLLEAETLRVFWGTAGRVRGTSEEADARG